MEMSRAKAFNSHDNSARIFPGPKPENLHAFDYDFQLHQNPKQVVYLKQPEKRSQINPYLSLYSQYYAETCNELTGPISATLRRRGNTASFEETLQR